MVTTAVEGSTDAGLVFTGAIGTGMKTASAVTANCMAKVAGVGKDSAAAIPIAKADGMAKGSMVAALCTAADPVVSHLRTEAEVSMVPAVLMAGAGPMAEATGNCHNALLFHSIGWQTKLPAVLLFITRII
jgi:hypothetical protein